VGDFIERVVRCYQSHAQRRLERRVRRRQPEGNTLQLPADSDHNSTGNVSTTVPKREEYRGKGAVSDTTAWKESLARVIARVMSGKRERESK